MTKIRVHCLSVSVDGYCAGPNQSLEAPLGRGGEALHQWHFATRTFARLHGDIAGGTSAGGDGVDDGFVARGFENLGAWIIGRNMFGPVRGPWPDDSWKGWWGEEPPYRVPVFVLTHHPREPLDMKGGTTFYFITGGHRAALDRARAAAAGKDIRIGGGAATVRQFLRDGLIDEMHMAIAPVVLGSGESVLGDIDAAGLGYRVTERAVGEGALHVVLTR